MSCAVRLHVMCCPLACIYGLVQRRALAVLVLFLFFLSMFGENSILPLSLLFLLLGCGIVPFLSFPFRCCVMPADVMVCWRRGVGGHIPYHLESDDAHVSNTFRCTLGSATAGCRQGFDLSVSLLCGVSVPCCRTASEGGLPKWLAETGGP